MRRSAKQGIFNSIALAAAVATVSALGFTTTAPPAYADYCKQWMFNGNYFLDQGNNTWLVFYGFNRAPSGNAALLKGGLFSPTRGPITGRLDGNHIFLQVHWDNGSVGTYEGTVDSVGHASGVTYNSKDASGNGNWKTDGEFLCADGL